MAYAPLLALVLSRLWWIAWFMLAKGNGPAANDLTAEGAAAVETLLVTTGVGTFGTIVSGGHTTLGERNWTFSTTGMGSTAEEGPSALLELLPPSAKNKDIKNINEIN